MILQITSVTTIANWDRTLLTTCCLLMTSRNKLYIFESTMYLHHTTKVEIKHIINTIKSKKQQDRITSEMKPLRKLKMKLSVK